MKGRVFLVASVILTTSCTLFVSDNRYTVTGTVYTCEHLDGILMTCFNKSDRYKTIVLDGGEAGKFSMDYSSGAFSI